MLDDIEEIEEIESFDEEITTQPFALNILEDSPCFEWYQNNYAKSEIPCLLLNPDLQIVWENLAFNLLFNKKLTNIKSSIVTLFSPYLDQVKIRDIYTSIKSTKTGYSWKGRVQASGKDFLTIIANLIIFPVFDKDNKELIAYFAVLDNITEENKNLLRNTFLSLLEASKLKDNDTGQHIERVNKYSKYLAETLYKTNKYNEIDREFIDNIGFLAAMHDVGKIGTPDDILNKSGSLDEREWKIMKEHTINGAYILSTYPAPMAKDIALFHHETWDGKGYPYSLSGDMIPLAARIVSIADVYDALRMKRSYKDSFTHKKAKEIIMAQKDTKFDPFLIKVFSMIDNKFAKIFDNMKD